PALPYDDTQISPSVPPPPPVSVVAAQPPQLLATMPGLYLQPHRMMLEPVAAPAPPSEASQRSTASLVTVGALVFAVTLAAALFWRYGFVSSPPTASTASPGERPASTSPRASALPAASIFVWPTATASAAPPPAATP